LHTPVYKDWQTYFDLYNVIVVVLVMMMMMMMMMMMIISKAGRESFQNQQWKWNLNSKCIFSLFMR
jgi:hypothetical protein